MRQRAAALPCAPRGPARPALAQERLRQLQQPCAAPLPRKASPAVCGSPGGSLGHGGGPPGAQAQTRSTVFYRSQFASCGNKTWNI